MEAQENLGTRDVASDVDSLQRELGIARRQVQDSAFRLAEVKDQCGKLQRDSEVLREVMKVKELRMQAALEEKDREIQDMWDRSDGPVVLPVGAGAQSAFLMERVADLRRKYARAASKATFFEQKLATLLEEIEGKSLEMMSQQDAFAKLSQAYLSANAHIAELQATEATQASVITELQASLQSQQTALQATTQDCQDLVCQVRRLIAENQRLKGREQSSEAGLDEVEDLQRENLALKKRLRERETLARAETTLTAQAEIREKEREIEQLQLQVADLQAGQQLHSTRPPCKSPFACLDCTTKDSCISGLQLQLAAAEQREFVLQTELCAVHEAWSQYNTQLTHTEAALNTANQEAERLKIQNETFSQQLATALKDNGRLRSQCEGMAVSNNTLGPRLAALEAEHVRVVSQETAEKDALYSKLKHLEINASSDKERLTVAIVKLRAEHENLLFELQSQTRSTPIPSQVILDQQAQINQLKSTLQALESAHLLQTTDMRSRLVEASRAEATQGQSSFLRLREQLAASVAQSQLREGRCQALGIELEEAKGKIAELEVGYAQLQTDIDTAAMQKQQTDEIADRRIRALQEKHSHLLNELQTSTQNSKALQEKLSEAQKTRKVDTASLLKLTAVLHRCQQQLRANSPQ